MARTKSYFRLSLESLAWLLRLVVPAGRDGGDDDDEGGYCVLWAWRVPGTVPGDVPASAHWIFATTAGGEAPPSS